MKVNFDILKVTESAAIAASAQVGRGDKIAADLAATNAMREQLNKIDFHAIVSIGEGRKDGVPLGLFCGDEVGGRRGVPNYDLAIDPIEGTSPTAKGGYEAMSVIAIGNRHSLFSSEVFYMKKLAVGPGIKASINDPIHVIVEQICLVTGKHPGEVTFCVLDRPRHEKVISEIRNLGCKIKLIPDCDVTAAILTCFPDSGIDVYVGIGGTPEGIISAAAVKCMNGDFQGILCDKDGNHVDDKVYQMEDLAKGDVVFCATGITLGSLLKGVKYTGDKIITHSLIMDSQCGTIRFIETSHRR